MKRLLREMVRALVLLPLPIMFFVAAGIVTIFLLSRVGSDCLTLKVMEIPVRMRQTRMH